MKKNIRILNFNDSRYFINDLNDIYWYKEHFDFDAVMYTEKNKSVNRERFYNICDELSVYPIYGLQIDVSPIIFTDNKVEILVFVSDRMNAYIFDILSERKDGENTTEWYVGSEVSVDDLLHYKGLMLLGLTLGTPYEPMDRIFGFCQYLFKPDFVFLTKGRFDEDDYDFISDPVYRYLFDSGIVTVPMRDQDNISSGIFVYDDMQAIAEDCPKRFLSMFHDYPNKSLCSENSNRNRTGG